MLRKFFSMVFAFFFLIEFFTTVSPAQGFRWPEEPKNLKVLPRETKGAELGEIMREFATALGTRCEHCHVGEGPDLTKFDFPSDQKVAKQKAREMIRMVQAINKKYISKLGRWDESPDGRIQVTCITCHRSQEKPRMLEDVLSNIISTDGVAAAVGEYRALREKYYGSFAFDFSSKTLTGLGERLSKEKNFDAALRILALEIEVNGESASTYYTLGSVQADAGKREEAIASFEKGLELASEKYKPFFQKKINRLRNP